MTHGPMGKLPRKLKKRMCGTRRRPRWHALRALRALCDLEMEAFWARQEIYAAMYAEVALAVRDAAVFGQVIYKDGKRVDQFAGIDYSKPTELPETYLDAIPWPGEAP